MVKLINIIWVKVKYELTSKNTLSEVKGKLSYRTNIKDKVNSKSTEKFVNIDIKTKRDGKMIIKYIAVYKYRPRSGISL